MSNWPPRKPAGLDASEKNSFGQGVFRKCDGCGETLPAEKMVDNFEVCPLCGKHHKLGTARWRQLLLDDGRLEEWDANLAPQDPLNFSDGRSYPERVASAQKSSKAKEAIEIGRAAIEGVPVAYGAFVFAFMGGSMGSVVGEKIARLFERATVDKLPVVLLQASGGARMQESILSLMQMAKSVAALERLRAAGLPFLSILLHPTTGGVAASFALLGDVNIAEPKALIGFAGPRVIETTIRQKLPPGFQSSEFLLAHGMVDRIVSRLDMRREIAQFARHFTHILAPEDRAGAQLERFESLMTRVSADGDCDLPRVRLGRAIAALFGRAPRGIQLGIGPMLAACARFDNPERSFRSLHITGTNGKGSVSAMLESVLRCAGLRAGMYTSPHLVRFAERIRIDGAPIDDASLLVHLEEVADHAPELTFFEATTLAAFLAFRAAKVDVAVIEVGIGGRLDATNVLLAEQVIATAITRVAFDHTELLGDTLSEIAGEKAGIAKAGVPMYIGPLDAESRASVDVVTQSVGAKVIATTDPAQAAMLERLVPREDVSLAGGYQRENRALAALVATALVPLGVSDEAIRHGIASAVWPGRFETIHARGAEWLLDAAHNPDGAKALAAALASDPRDVLVFGTLADKEWPEMLDLVVNVAPSRIYAPPSSGLSTRPAADPALLAARHSGVAAASVEDALDRAKACAAESGGNRIVVCGSIFLVGEARARLLDLPRDPPLAL